MAAGCLLLAVGICVLVATLLRWLAPRLLGPSTAERLALAEERELQLAERNRVAHELHDSIGHTLTAATIQAAVAGEVLASDPAAARAAMRSIEESTRAALEDLDYVLGVLREERPGAVPSRTLSDLPALIDRLRHAGAVVEVNLSGDLSQIQGHSLARRTGSCKRGRPMLCGTGTAGRSKSRWQSARRASSSEWSTASGQ